VLKRLGIGVLGSAVFLYLAFGFDKIFGPNSFILVVIAILAVGALLDWWQKKRAKKQIDKIAPDDPRTIRFDGSPDQTRRAVEIGETMRWHVEQIAHADPSTVSVRFSPTDSSSSPKSLLKALFDAGIAWNVEP